MSKRSEQNDHKIMCSLCRVEHQPPQACWLYVVLFQEKWVVNKTSTSCQNNFDLFGFRG